MAATDPASQRRWRDLTKAVLESHASCASNPATRVLALLAESSEDSAILAQIPSGETKLLQSLARPLFVPLADALLDCASNDRPTRLTLPSPPLLEETAARRARLETLALRLREILGPFAGPDANLDSAESALALSHAIERVILEEISIADILSLLAFRTTVGSICVFPPPSLSELVASFTAPHAKDVDVAAQKRENRRKILEKLIAEGKVDPSKVKLDRDDAMSEDTADAGSSSPAGGRVCISVGARAYSKHCLRDAKGEGFWGTCNGPSQVQNEHAKSTLFKVLSNAVWINLHQLPHNQGVLEIRTAEGHGARWMLTTIATADESVFSYADVVFRGFLEPTMADGHALKWRHG